MDSILPKKKIVGQGRPQNTSRPLFYFIGSGVSAMGDTNLPDWDTFVKGLMTGLGRCAGLRHEDVSLLEKLDQHRSIIKDEISEVRKSNKFARPSYLENYHVRN